MKANVSQLIESRAIFPNTLMNHTLGQVVADVGPLFLIHLIALFGNTMLCITFLKSFKNGEALRIQRPPTDRAPPWQMEISKKIGYIWTTLSK